MESCEYLDLETSDWKSIQNLPRASYQVLATLLNKEIILSGYHLNCAYLYNESVYISILNLPKDKFKIVYEGWIFTDSILYENQEQNNAKWLAYNINNKWSNALLTYSIFKNKENLYFIDKSSNLMRINTKLKKLEQILFS